MWKFVKDIFGGGKSIIGEAADVVDRFVYTKEEKQGAFERVLDRAVADRQDARRTMSQNPMLHNVFALTFLLSYIGLTVYIFYLFSTGSLTDMPAHEIAFMSSTFGAMSMKVGTITDFLFGGSSTERKTHEFNYQNKDNK